MAYHKSAKKAAKQNEKKRLKNAAERNKLRTTVKEARVAAASGDKDTAKTAAIKAQKALDKAASKGIIKKNAASRVVGRLNAKAKKVAGK